MILDLPGGLFESTVVVNAAITDYDSWYQNVYRSWRPSVLKQTAGTLSIDGGSCLYRFSTETTWPGDYCNFRITKSALSFEFQLVWSVGNQGAAEAAMFLSESLESLAHEDVLVGSLAFTGDGYAVESETQLNSRQLQLLVGDSSIEWKLRRSPWHALEHIEVEDADGRLVFRML